MIVGLLGAAGGAIVSVPLTRYLRRAAAGRVHATSQLTPGVRRRRQALVFLGLALVLGAGLGSLNLPTYLRLARHAEAIGATVIQPDCDNHATFTYRFVVGGRLYTGKGSAISVSCERLRVGDQVEAYYLPGDPETNAPGNVRQALHNEVVSIVLAATVFPFFLILVLRWRGIL
jgi:hypothetical protein